MAQQGMTLKLEGADKLRAQLLQLSNKSLPVLHKELYRFGEDIMADSKQNYVPVDKGNLKASGTVSQAMSIGGDSVQVVLGYGGAAAPYALAVHENPRSGKTGGVSPSGAKYRTWAAVGQWKYLEAPFLKWKPKLAGRLTAALRIALTGSGR